MGDHAVPEGQAAPADLRARDDSSLSPYLKLDVGHFVAGVRPGFLFRSAWGVEPGLLAAVNDHTRKIDLRGRKHVTPEELALDHSKIAVIPIEQTAGSPILQDGANRDDYTANYLDMLNHSGQALAKVVAVMADQVANGGSVIGCSVGRDRTGVVLALAFRGLGLPIAVILRAETAMRERLAAIIEVSPHPFLGFSREQVAHRLRAPHESIADVIEACEQRWTTVRAYLARHGLAESTWKQLRASLLLSRHELQTADSDACAP